MATQCPKCGERILLQVDRCPRCQTPLNIQAAAPGEDYFGGGRRDRQRDRTADGERDAARQEKEALEQELKEGAAARDDPRRPSKLVTDGPGNSDPEGREP